MRKATIRFLSEDGVTILDKKLIGIPLKEDFIINKSIEFFNDKDPCMIHRSAVMKRTYMELFDYLIKIKDEGKDIVKWNELPSAIRDAINLPKTPITMDFNLERSKF